MKKLILLVLVAACGDSNKATPDAPVISAPDAAIDAMQPAVTCFSGTPTTHDELINACVNEAVVTRIMKMPVLPLLNSDGSLPQLP
jgi:hypothetical protein